jgi:GTP cyclohydrolase I
MHPSLQQILDVLEEVAPSRLAENWDNPGLQIGGRSDPIERILLSLDPSFEAVCKAADIGAQLLLSHHPLIFKPLSSIDRNGYPGDVLFQAVKTGVALVSIHTNLDAAIGGINDQLAGILGLGTVRPLAVEEADPSEPGIGRIGTLDTPRLLDDLARDVKSALRIPMVGVVGPLDRAVQQVAVVGGSGGSLVPNAARAGADVLVTGDLGHHDALTASCMGLAVIDAGHFHTEKAALEGFSHTLRSDLQARGWAVEVQVFGEEESPVQYR